MENLTMTSIDIMIARVLARSVVDDLGAAKEALGQKTPDASLAIARLAGVREMVQAASLNFGNADALARAESGSLNGIVQDIDAVIDQARCFIAASETDPGLADRPQEVFRAFASIHLDVVRLLKNRSLRRRCMFAAYGTLLPNGEIGAADDSRYDG